MQPQSSFDRLMSKYSKQRGLMNQPIKRSLAAYDVSLCAKKVPTDPMEVTEQKYIAVSSIELLINKTDESIANKIDIVANIKESKNNKLESKYFQPT